MDSLGSLSLATEPPYEELLQREPTKRKESIINGKMWKHIILQAIIELILLLLLFLYAPKFIKENDCIRLAETEVIKRCYDSLPGGVTDTSYIIYGTEIKWSSKTKLKIGANEEMCGKYGKRQNLSVAFKEFYNANGGTVHMTLIFNIFVFYTLFNQINCRVIDDSFNIFIRLFKSMLFPLITILEMGFQVLLVSYGNNFFHCAENGLTGGQWGITFGFSSITFIVNFCIKLIPLENLIDKYFLKKEKEQDNNNIENEDNKDNNDNETNKNEVKKIRDEFDQEIINSYSERGGLLRLRSNNHNNKISKKE